MKIQNKNHLKREIGVIGLIANTLNIIIGAGIFALPALVAGYLAEASILAYLICGLLIIGIVLCFAEVGSKITESGGAIAYVQAAFGNYWGFIAAALLWFGIGVLVNAALINGMADLLAIHFQIFNNLFYRSILFFLVLGGFAIVNILGVKYGNQMVKINTFIKMMPLLLLIIFGWSEVKYENLEWQKFPSINNLGAASLLLFFAFGGSETALSVSGEIKNPKRIIPIGVISGILIVIVLFILLQTICQGVLGNELVKFKDAPLAAVAERIFGKIGTNIIIYSTVFSIFASLSGWMLNIPRVIFASANNSWLPKFISKTQPKYATPYWAIMFYATLAYIFAVSGGFKQLIVIASASLLLLYLAVVLAVIRLKMDTKYQEIDGFKMPFGYFIPSICALAIVWFLSNLSQKEGISIATALILLSLIYFVLQKSNKTKP